MGRNYRCWIAGGLQARAPVKCLCFPSCLPSKDLHILTHYSVLWSWSAWLPQPAITLIAFKKLKSFKALWPHSWGKMYVCFSPSPSSLSSRRLLQLRPCEASNIVAAVWTMHRKVFPRPPVVSVDLLFSAKLCPCQGLERLLFSALSQVFLFGFCTILQRNYLFTYCLTGELEWRKVGIFCRWLWVLVPKKIGSGSKHPKEVLLASFPVRLECFLLSD